MLLELTSPDFIMLGMLAIMAAFQIMPLRSALSGFSSTGLITVTGEAVRAAACTSLLPAAAPRNKPLTASTRQRCTSKADSQGGHGGGRLRMRLSP